MKNTMLTLSRQLLIPLLLCSTAVQGSVVMTGTRVIYPAQVKEKSIQLSNKSAVPFIVQVQMDNDEQGSNKIARVPFIASPAIFRVEPHSGQSVLLRFSGGDMPRDRESVYYLRFTQLPALASEQSHKNKLVLAITNRVKVFYRPQGLAGTASKVGESLTVQRQGGSLVIHNPTPFYANVARASLRVKDRDISLGQQMMVAPKSSLAVDPAVKIGSVDGLMLKVVTVNDYGTQVVTERRL